MANAKNDILLKRTHRLNEHQLGSGDVVVYVMSRDMRVQDNWALLFAQQLVQQEGKSLAVVYRLIPNYLGGSLRQWRMKIEILHDLEKEFAKLHIPLWVTMQKTSDMKERLKQGDVAAVITDFCPLREAQKEAHILAKGLSVPVIEVDAHNIVPCWVVSQKQEFAAYTLRPRIHKYLPEFLTDFPKLSKQSNPPMWPKTSWKDIEKTPGIDKKASTINQYSPKKAKKALRDFITHRLSGYAAKRNDPNSSGQSDLSPYLHLGVISPQRVAYIVKHARAPLTDREAFLEELIVRRELADNFCFYNPHYDSPKGFPDWAKRTLAEHQNDTRAYVYTLSEFEHAQTHDALWNAAQQEMVTTGKMHGFMRMYWAKKILEWTASPEDAMRIAIALNNRYELDGRDPNGYAGIAWSIGGVHDRAWFDRPVFGKVRYMNASGCSRKFDTKAYIQKHPTLL